MVAPRTDDEARWAEARSLLDGTPSGSARRRLRRWRTLRLLFVASVVLTGAVAGLVVHLVLDGGVDGAADGTPLWRRITGFTVVALGLVVTVVGAVTQVRAVRALGAWRSPLAPLTREQRTLLLAQVRGRAPVDAARLPQARHLAEVLVQQRTAPVSQFGLLALFAGQWIMAPTAFRLALVGLLAVLTLVAVRLLRRDASRARAFLLAHPAPGQDGSAA